MIRYAGVHPTGTSLTITNDQGGEVGRILYDPYGGVLTSTIPATLTTALAVQGSGGDPDTGLVHLGNGRYYDPSMGRPLQPNPVGGAPIVPQALNRYAATPVGQPGVAEGAVGAGLDLRLLAMGLAANVSLELAGRNVAVETGSLTLEGSLPALSKALRVGEGSPVFGGLRIERQALDDLLPFEAVTLGNIGRVNYLGQGRFYLSKFDEVLDTAGVRSVRFKRGLLLGEAKTLRTFSSIGLTGVIDIGFELYEFGTSTGQWGNPYLTSGQKAGQAVIVILSDIALAGGLAVAATTWEITLPVALIWTLSADSVFASIPGTSLLYQERRRLEPLR